jgi:hypothetical protein
VIVRGRELTVRDQLLVPEPMPMTYDDLLGIGIGYGGYNDVPYALAECVCQPRCTPQVVWPLQHRRAVILVKFSKHHLTFAIEEARDMPGTADNEGEKIEGRGVLVGE